jgi:hypothetical protein
MTKLCECGCGEPTLLSKQTRRGYRKGEPQRFLHGHHLRIDQYKAMIITPERNEKIRQAHRDGRIPNPTPKPGASNPMWKGDEVGYAGAHQRLGAVSGDCVSCGEPAEEWAIDHSYPSLMVGYHGGREKAYSPDPDAYVALCRPCHRSADRNGGWRRA